MSPLVWSLILLACGLFMLALEFFVPSGGSLTLLCILALIGAVVYGFLQSFMWGVAIIVMMLILIPLMLAVMVQIWPHTSLGKRILPDHSGGDEAVLPQTEHKLGRNKLIGKVGIAKTKMLPSGAIVIDQKTYDAVSEGGAISAGDPVQVFSVKGNRIAVRPYCGTVSEESDTTPVSDIMSQPIENLELDIIDGLLVDDSEPKQGETLENNPE